MKNNTVYVWDIGVRVFHWLLVAAFTIAYFSGEEESAVHVYAGYIVAGLILFRVVWGLIGSRHARFSDFLYGPRKVFSYVRSLAGGAPQHFVGHNPAGGWLICLMLISLGVVTISGLKVYGLEGYGPLAASEQPAVGFEGAAAAEEEGNGGEAAEEYWEEIHEAAANSTLFLVFVHISGVLVSSLLHRENLVKAMITGRKRESLKSLEIAAAKGEGQQPVGK